ncbi:UDP-N-acetylmuramoyl-L-alanine--D-glutamate ligase [Paenibacillus glacialis]|uniref:UDP-N-acetylmuramoylalanine--D-glutamate ligase n=1 Tax=Paenibacillus glacialis TaxID=494026 RepID=A0A168D6A1_9BACL|nr:UDP-N-acetylmuramoyl-L-alanine--D-glutamate ligase [Paenibacillus glacialis]OAB33906.1 UDP-N-acetylmuramoylalanine--D-glutamate ligase [Paenibacillus glacialis]
MNHPDTYRDKQVVVLGLAKSGVEVAKVLHKMGALVTVNDKKEKDQCPEASELEVLGISVICGSHPSDLIHTDIALVVKNPGIPYSVPPLVKAMELGIDIVTEVEVAYHLSEAPMIGITGSNGKTTTTTWVGNILRNAGMSSIVAGNIGTPLCAAIAGANEDDWMVVELSSFQLKGTQQFRPRIGCLLNVAETHLDYHGGMEDYVSSKVNMFVNQREDDIAILNWDDPYCRSLVPHMKGRILPFSMSEELVEGIYVSPPYIASIEDSLMRSVVYRDAEGIIHDIIPVEDIGLPGRFNVENALAACAIAIAAGVSIDQLSTPLSAFRGVEHRLEYVKETNGVSYYNNSKATNSKATTMALTSFKNPIVLIAGGLDRGSDYMELLTVFGERVKAVIVLGETKEKIAKVAELAGLKDISIVDTVEDSATTLITAVKEAARIAEQGDVVLLSPACASWDMFASYEERGRIFKEAVHNL